MQIQQLSFADMMAKYVEKPTLPILTKSNVSIMGESFTPSVTKKTSISAYEPSYTSYSNITNATTKSINWIKLIIGVIVFLGGGLLIYYYRKHIKKWYAKNFEKQNTEDDLTLNN